MKSARIVAALAALALAGCATEPVAPTPAPAAAPAAPPPPSAEQQLKAREAVLERKPSVGPLQPFAAPVPEVATLANGLTLVVVQRKDAALSTLIFVTKHGAVHDQALPGLASLTGELLQAGSAGRSASQIADAVTALGTELHVGAAREDLTASLTVLPEKFADAAALLGEVMLSPNLAPKELERVREERKSKLIALLDEPRAVASNAFERVLFGETPYGKPLLGTQGSVAKVKLGDVKKFLAGVGGANSAVVVAGPLPLAEVRPLIEKAFGKLQKGQAEPSLTAKPESKRPPVVLLDKPGAPQSVVRMGEPGVPASSPDRYALELANTIFGGSFTSRINQNLREAHGYTYGARSSFDMERGGGTFMAGADVKTDVTGASVRELNGELQKMLSPGLDQAEIDKAKALFTAGLVDELQTTPGTARAVAELWVNALPLDELSRMLPAVAKLTAADVNAAWKRAVDAGQLSLIIVGDAKAVEPQLEAEKLPKPMRMAPIK